MNAIHIHQLRFSGREIQRRSLLADLERVAWPILSDQEYLFIRRLQASQAPGQLAQTLAIQADASRQRAVSGWLPQALHAEAVYFANYAELLACLSRDLLRGQKRWYWREWAGWFARPVADGLFDCWCQQQALLPAIAAELAIRGELASFWQSLPEAFLQHLLRALSPSADFMRSLATQVEGFVDFDVPAHWLSCWRPVFAVRSDLMLPSQQLAALIILRQWQPLRLMQTDALTWFQAVVAQLMPGVKNPSVKQQTDTTVEPNATKESSTLAAEGFSSAQDFVSAEIGVGSYNDNQSAQSAAPRDGQTALAQQTVLTMSEQRVQRPVVDDTGNKVSALLSGKQARNFDARPTSVNIGSSRFYPDNAASLDRIELPARCLSEQAGVFYLLNFLNLPAVQDSLLTNAASAACPSAWGWLYRLGDALGWQPEPALLQLFTFFCGFDDLDALQQLPALPQREELVHLGKQRYGAEVFNSTLFAIDAVIEADVSHIDVYFDPQAVNLDIRRSGLDIDPGWLPWLGKVVKFHYQSWPAV